MAEADHNEHLGSWVDVQVLGRNVLSLRRDPSELERDAELARAIAEAAAGVLCRGFGAAAEAPLLRSRSCGCCRWYLILCRRPNLFAAPPQRRGCRGWGAGIQSS